jgi:AcrR family transcriptional regulator
VTPREGPRPATWGHGKEQLLKAARDVFSEKGYARGGIREIASRAGVTEPMIYQHFGSKKALFEAATVEPFTGYISDYFTNWSRNSLGERSATAESEDFLRGLYDVLYAERKVLLAMVAVREFDPGFSAGPQYVEEAFAQALKQFQDLIDVESAKRGYRKFDSHIWVRLVFGAVLSLALHGSMLNSGRFLDRDKAIAELAQMTIRGAQK